MFYRKQLTTLYTILFFVLFLVFFILQNKMSIKYKYIMSQTSSMMTILSNTFIIVGTLLLFITSGSTSIGGILAGYSFIGIGLLLTLSYTIKLINDNPSESKSWFGAISPFILILSVIGYSIYLVVTYQNKIKSGHISQGYYNFSNISTVLILVQLMLRG